MTYLSEPPKGKRPSVGAQIAALYNKAAAPTDAAPPLPEQPKAPAVPPAPAPVQGQLTLVAPTPAANEAPKPPAPAPAPKPVTPSQLKGTPPPAPKAPKVPDVELPVPESIDPVLVRILSWKRPFETVGEIKRWLESKAGLPERPTVTLAGLAFKGRPATDEERDQALPLGSPPLVCARSVTAARWRSTSS